MFGSLMTGENATSFIKRRSPHGIPGMNQQLPGGWILHLHLPLLSSLFASQTDVAASLRCLSLTGGPTSPVLSPPCVPDPEERCLSPTPEARLVLSGFEPFIRYPKGRHGIATSAALRRDRLRPFLEHPVMILRTRLQIGAGSYYVQTKVARA